MCVLFFSLVGTVQGAEPLNAMISAGLDTLYDADEIALRDYMENNSYRNFSVNYITDDAWNNYTLYNNRSDIDVVIYFSSGNTGDMRLKLQNLTYGVMVTGDSLYDEMELCTGDTAHASMIEYNITNITHPAMSAYPSLGTHTIYNPANAVIACSNPSSDGVLLAEKTDQNINYVVSWDVGAERLDSVELEYRRVVFGLRSEHALAFVEETNQTYIQLLEWLANEEEPSGDSEFPVNITRETYDDDSMHLIINTDQNANTTLYRFKDAGCSINATIIRNQTTGSNIDYHLRNLRDGITYYYKAVVSDGAYTNTTACYAYTTTTRSLSDYSSVGLTFDHVTPPDDTEYTAGDSITLSLNVTTGSGWDELYDESTTDGASSSYCYDRVQPEEGVVTQICYSDGDCALQEINVSDGSILRSKIIDWGGTDYCKAITLDLDSNYVIGGKGAGGNELFGIINRDDLSLKCNHTQSFSGDIYAIVAQDNGNIVSGGDQSGNTYLSVHNHSCDLVSTHADDFGGTDTIFGLEQHYNGDLYASITSTNAMMGRINHTDYTFMWNKSIVSGHTAYDDGLLMLKNQSIVGYFDNSDIMIISLSPNGAEEWNTTWGYSGMGEDTFKAVETWTGNIGICGRSDGSSPLDLEPFYVEISEGTEVFNFSLTQDTRVTSCIEYEENMLMFMGYTSGTQSKVIGFNKSVLHIDSLDLYHDHTGSWSVNASTIGNGSAKISTTFTGIEGNYVWGGYGLTSESVDGWASNYTFSVVAPPQNDNGSVVTLNTPSDSAEEGSVPITLSCTAEDDDQVDNVTLYTNTTIEGGGATYREISISQTETLNECTYLLRLSSSDIDFDKANRNDLCISTDTSCSSPLNIYAPEELWNEADGNATIWFKSTDCSQTTYYLLYNNTVYNTASSGYGVAGVNGSLTLFDDFNDNSFNTTLLSTPFGSQCDEENGKLNCSYGEAKYATYTQAVLSHPYAVIWKATNAQGGLQTRSGVDGATTPYYSLNIGGTATYGSDDQVCIDTVCKDTFALSYPNYYLWELIKGVNYANTSVSSMDMQQYMTFSQSISETNSKPVVAEEGYKVGLVATVDWFLVYPTPTESNISIGSEQGGGGGSAWGVNSTHGCGSPSCTAEFNVTLSIGETILWSCGATDNNSNTTYADENRTVTYQIANNGWFVSVQLENISTTNESLLVDFGSSETITSSYVQVYQSDCATYVSNHTNSSSTTNPSFSIGNLNNNTIYCLKGWGNNSFKTNTTDFENFTTANTPSSPPSNNWYVTSQLDNSSTTNESFTITFTASETLNNSYLQYYDDTCGVLVGNVSNSTPSNNPNFYISGVADNTTYCMIGFGEYNGVNNQTEYANFTTFTTPSASNSTNTSNATSESLIWFTEANDGTSVVDTVNGNDGTGNCTTTPRGSETGIFCDYGELISIPKSVDVNITGNFTISTWIKPVSTLQHIFAEELVAKQPVLNIRTDNRIQAGNDEYVEYSDYLTNNTWQYLTVVYSGSGSVDSSTVTIYVNASLNDTNVGGSSSLNFTEQYYLIGERVRGDSLFQAYIDNYAIYNRALNQTEIQDLFDADGNPGITAKFQITAKDYYNSSSIMEFMVNLTNSSGTYHYNTTNGTIVTDIPRDSGTVDLLFYDVDYFSNTTSSVDTASNYQGSMYQSILNLTVLESLSLNPVSSFTVVGDYKSYPGTNGNVLVYLNEGQHNLLVTSGGFSNTTFNHNSSALMTKNKTVYLSANLTFYLYEESTGQHFDVGATNQTKLKVFCENSTEEVIITAWNQASTVGCQWDYMKLDVQYNLSDTYYRTLMPEYTASSVNWYLIDLNDEIAVQVVLKLNDLIGTYGGSKATLKRYVNGTEREVIEQNFDVENEVNLYLVRNAQYTLSITSTTGQVRNVGYFIADSAGEKTVTIPTVDYVPSTTTGSGGSTSWGWESTDTYVRVVYNDSESSTTDVSFSVKNASSGDTLYTTSGNPGTSSTYTYLTDNETGILVCFNATHSTLGSIGECRPYWGSVGIGNWSSGGFSSEEEAKIKGWAWFILIFVVAVGVGIYSPSASMFIVTFLCWVGFQWDYFTIGSTYKDAAVLSILGILTVMMIWVEANKK